MIDTHCHLLPALDDGPGTQREALALARGLAGAGVSAVVCTPHFSRRFPTDHARARASLDGFRTELAAVKLPLRLALAAEVGSAAAAEAPADALSQRQLGGGHLLVELETDTPAGAVDVIADRARDLGLTPVFAHPERCRAVRSQPRVLDAARSDGALVQVIVPSLMGRWGDRAASSAWQLLESGRADLIATDAHRARHAGRYLTGALERVAARVGRRRLVELTETVPARLLPDPGKLE